MNFAIVLKQSALKMAGMQSQMATSLLAVGCVTFFQKKKCNRFFRFIATCKSVIRNIQWIFGDLPTITSGFQIFL